MSGITVYLTTTKWTVVTDYDKEVFKTLDIPVCSANFLLGSFGYSPHEQEEMEQQWAELLKKMAKFVFIDLKSRSIYIGDDSNCKSETALIEYTETNYSKYSKRFFERWKQTESLMLEFTIYDFKNQPLMCLKGSWEQDHWLKLEIYPTNFIKVTLPNITNIN